MYDVHEYENVDSSVTKTYFIQSIILYFGKVEELYFIYTFFSQIL